MTDEDNSFEHNCEEALEKIKQSIQDYINLHAGEPRMLDTAVVIFEDVGFNAENGKPNRSVHYLIPTDSFSMAMGIGLCDLGKAYMQRDLVSVYVKQDGEED